jgi:hypothetical protein
MDNIENNRKILGIPINCCCLCHSTNELKLSHIIPSFVYKWIKETSATGYLRGGKKPEQRLQDGIKSFLLCGDCEQLFSGFEQKFANIVFYPYVKTELDQEGVAQSILTEFEYTDWFVKFCLSIQFRQVVGSGDLAKLNKDDLNLVISEWHSWRKFLLGQSSKSGEAKTYFVFLQNLAGGWGNLDKIHPRAAFYCLRATDMTPVLVHNKLKFYFIKLGPMFFITQFNPYNNEKMKSSQIRLHGAFQTATSINDPLLGSFILKIRPEEVFNHLKPSQSVEKRVENAFRKNPERAIKSMTAVAQAGDFAIQDRIAKYTPKNKSDDKD